MNKNIGDMTESELQDFIIELQEENSRYERINQKYQEVIEKAINFIDMHMYEDHCYVDSEDRLKEILKKVNNMIFGFGLGCLIVLVVISLC